MSHKIEMPEKLELENRYLTEGSSISSVAKYYKTSNPTIRKWLLYHGIERKSHRQASMEANNRKRNIVPSKERLEKDYSNHSIKELEIIYGVGQETIYIWLDMLDIPLKTLSEATYIAKSKQFENIQFSKEHLEQLYNNHGHIGVVSDILNVSYSHTRNLFKKYGIKSIPHYRSRGEIDLFNICEELFPGWISCDKSIINPFELDIYNSEKKLAIEYCGSYWHSQKFGEKDRNYHYSKFKKCQDKGVELITVFESDDISKVKSLIKTKLTLNNRIYARNLYAVELSAEAITFNNEHHIQGHCGSSYSLGLTDGNMLYMVLSMGKSRFNKKYEWECLRMTSHSDYTVVGGASKLFSCFRNNMKPKNIITYSDMRFGSGKVYSKCGFNLSHIANPNYWYFHKNKPNIMWSRVKFQKHKLADILENFNPNLSEYENMVENGYDRIWDCGNSVWIWEN